MANETERSGRNGSCSDEAYQARVGSAVLEAIARASLIDIDGTETVYIRSRDACDALVTAMAALMEEAPPCRTRKGMKAVSDAVGRNLLTMMIELRKMREETGRTIFDARVINPN